MTSELLRQVRVLDPVTNGDHVADVHVQSGQIVAIAPSISEYPDQTQVRECSGFVLAPGLVDLYSSVGEPGYESRETFESLAAASLAGGITRISVLPNSQISIDQATHLQGMRSHVQRLPAPHPKIQFWGALTQHIQGKAMNQLAELEQADVLGFADGQPLSDLSLGSRLLEYARSLQKPIALWACDRTLQRDGIVRDGLTATRLGLPTIPVMAETAALATLLEAIAELQTPVHFMRISTERGVHLIRQAKAQGLPITASTTWMHVVLNTDVLSTYDPNLHVEPPLGNPSDQQALVQGLEDGTLDAIAIDHTPFTYEEKTVAFAESPPGAIGLEFALPVLWQTFVTSGLWTPLQLWRYISTNPCHCLHQTPGAIAPQQPTEMILFDPQAEWVVAPTALKSRSHNTPWLGQSITGRVLKTWISS
jgi:dihydroorotase